MAEPEEIIIDAARHATVFVSRLWSRPNQGQDKGAQVGDRGEDFKPTGGGARQGRGEE